MGFGGVNDIGELDAILDKEYRDIVRDEVEGALLGVELGRKPAGVSHDVGGTAGSHHRGEPREHRGGFLLRKEPGPRNIAGDSIGFEHAMRCGTAGVHHAFWDALVVEVGNLFSQMVVL